MEGLDSYTNRNITMSPETKAKVVKKINGLLLFLTPEERIEILKEFCLSCGKQKKGRCCGKL